MAQIKALSHSPLLALGHGNGVAAWPGMRGFCLILLALDNSAPRSRGCWVDRAPHSAWAEPESLIVDRSTEHLIHGIVWTIGEEVEHESA